MKVERGLYKVALVLVAILAVVSGDVYAQGPFGGDSFDAEQYSGIKPQLVSGVAIGESTTTYTLGKGDIVQISVRNQDEFSGNFVVGPDGKIQYDFVGDIKTEGLTKLELTKIIVKELNKYVKNPNVNISIVGYLSKFVYVMGDVGRPGKYPMMGNQVSLREVIIAAGLPRPSAALRRSFVITPHEVSPAHKKVDLYLLLYKGKLAQNVTLHPGDLVVVPSTIPSEINRALTTLLSPFSKAASATATYKYLTE